MGCFHFVLLRNHHNAYGAWSYVVLMVEVKRFISRTEFRVLHLLILHSTTLAITSLVPISDIFWCLIYHPKYTFTFMWHSSFSA